MAKTGITFDDALWKHKVRKLAKQAKVDEKDFVKDQAGLFLRDIAKFAPPYAKFPTGSGKSIGSGADKKIGELAILSDLDRLFFVPKENSVYLWAKKTFPTGPIYKGRLQIGAGVATSVEDMRRHHNRYRKPNGRSPSLKGPQKIWASASLLKKYHNLEKKKVGKAKAALAAGSLKFNPKIRIPAWVRRHVNTAKTAAFMTGNIARFSASAAGLHHIRTSTIKIVTGARLRAMEKRLLFLLKDNAKKAGFKVK